MAGRVRVREISDDEGNRLKRIVRRGSGSVVTWRRAQMVLWSAQGMSVAQIAGLAFTSEDRVRDVLHNFNADGFGSLYPRYAGGHPPVFTLAQRREIKKIAKSKPAEHGLAFSRWSLAKLADFLVAEGVVEDISHEGLRELLAAEGVSFQAVKTWKQSSDPDYAAKKARVDHLYAIADGEAAAGPGDPDVVICVDEFGPLNLQPRPGRQWARRGGTAREPDEAPRRRLRATYTRTKGVRHLFAALELGTDKMYGHIKKRKRRGEFLEFCRYLRSLHPPRARIAIVCDNLANCKTPVIQAWLARHPRFRLHFTPTGSSWINQVERWFGFLTDQMIRRGVHKSVQALEADIRAWIEHWNANPRPFAWTKTADEILDSLAKYLARISGAAY